jgi:hypothetical protein
VRWALLLLLVGCRQIFGIDDPGARALDAPVRDAGLDGMIDGTLADGANDCTMPPGVTLPDVVEETLNGGTTSLKIMGFAINGGGKYLVTGPGTMLTVTFDYTWLDTSCASSCIDQIEIGYAPGDRVGCPFDAAVTKGVMVPGNRSYVMIGPTQKGWTSVRLAIAQALSCTAGGASTWYEGPPPAEDTVGYICVH